VLLVLILILTIKFIDIFTHQSTPNFPGPKVGMHVKKLYEF
jgi:hypothetical protein